MTPPSFRGRAGAKVSTSRGLWVSFSSDPLMSVHIAAVAMLVINLSHGLPLELEPLSINTREV
jgi:hypothetical protein